MSKVRPAQRQRGQDVVEYGIIVAVIAVASILAFNALSAAERAYFQGPGSVQPALAPTAAVFGTFQTPVPPTATSTPAPTSTPTAVPTPVAGTPTPGFTLNISVPKKSTGEVDLTWTPPGGSITAYSIYRGTSAGTEKWVNSTAGAATGFNDVGLVSGTKYFYYVVAIASSPYPRTSEQSGTAN